MEMDGVSTASKGNLRRPSITLARTQTENIRKAWLLIRQGSLSLWQKRYVIASGHYVQVFALATPGAAPLLALDLNRMTIGPEKITSDVFELKVKSNDVMFSFKASDKDDANDWWEFLNSLQQAVISAQSHKTRDTPVQKEDLIAKMLAQQSSRLAARDDLESLEKNAKRRAAAALATRFQEMNDLSHPGQDLEAFQEECKLKLSAVSAVVDTTFRKHDARVQLILQRVDDSADGVTGIRNGMYDLQKAVNMSSFWAKDDEIRMARSFIRDAQYAKQNLSHTLDLCHQWLGVPTRVSQLKNALETEPLMLLTVYEEMRDLDKWRRSLEELLQKVGSMIREGGAMHGAGGRPDASMSDMTPEMYQDVTSGFGVHMASVKELAIYVKETLWANVKRCFELGTTNPAVLVMTFRVIEAHEKAKEEKMRLKASMTANQDMSQAYHWEERGLPPGGSGTTSPTGKPGSELEQALLEDEEDYRIVAQTILHQAISERAENAFRVFEKLDSGVTPALSAASHVLSELSTIVKEVAPCMPQDYALVILAKNLYQSHLLPCVEALYSHPNNLSTVELLKVIEWLDYYNAEMNSLLSSGDDDAASDAYSCYEFSQAAETLLSEYMARMRHQLTEWIDNVIILDADMVKDGEGHFATAYPNDMLRLLKMQLSTAMSLLRPHRFIFVLGPAGVALRSSQMQFDDLLMQAEASISSQEESGKVLDEDATPFTVERLVTIGNDLVRLSNLLGAYRDELDSTISASHNGGANAGDLGGGISLTESLMVLDDASREYLELAFKTTNLLSRTILLGLIPEPMKSIGGAEWEATQGGDIYVETIVKTLRDWFDDVVQWSDDYLWPKCCRNCLNFLLSTYIQEVVAAGGVSNLKKNAFGLSSESLSGKNEDKGSANMPLGRTTAAMMMAKKWRAKATNMPKSMMEGSSTSEDKQTPQEVSTGNNTGAGGLGSGGGNDEEEDNFFTNTYRVAARLKADYTVLVNFFEEFEDDLGMAGLRMEVKDFISPLELLAQALEAQSPSDARTVCLSFAAALKQCDYHSFPSSKTATFQDLVSRLLKTIWSRRPELIGSAELACEYDAVFKDLFKTEETAQTSSD